MKITRREVAQKLTDYLHHQIALTELVYWAESAMMDADFDQEDFDALRDIISRIGLADVKAFGITWEECEDFLSRLGYQVDVMVSQTAVSV
ncbi:MAG: hypothetical protein QME81_05350 [bacterium]|nr:hypothetical protein [bacterium]